MKKTITKNVNALLWIKKIYINSKGIFFWKSVLLDVQTPTLIFCSQFYIQLVFKAPLCITLTISNQKIVRGSLFFQLFEREKKKYIKAFLCNFTMRTLKYFQKKFNFFLANKSWKKHLKKLLESGIKIRVRLLIFEVFFRGYVLIKWGNDYWFLIFKNFFKNF